MAPNHQHRNLSGGEIGELSGLMLDKTSTSTTPHEAYGTDRMIDFEPLPQRTSLYGRRSFMEEFVYSKGPPQIIILIMLFAFGFGSVIGVVPAIMSDRYARINHGYNGDKICNDYGVREKPQTCLLGSSDAQNAVAVEQFISNGLTFFTSSLVGSLSDEYGRKGILLFGVFLGTLSPLVLLLIQLHPQMSPIWYYTVGALQGLVNWTAVALSALSDVMPPEWRAASFGLVLAGFSLGFACAPQLALYMGHLHVTILSITVVLVGFLVILFFFPETLSAEAAERAKLIRLAEVEDLEGSQRYLWYVYRPIRELSILNRNTLFRLLSALAFFSGISSSGDRSLFLYYIEEQFGFTDKDIAVFFLIVGFLGIFVQGIFLKIANDLLGERRVVIFSFFIGSLHDVIYCFAKTKVAIYSSAALASLVMMAFPTISAIKSNNVNETEQGRIQGALYSVQAFASAFGPMLFRAVFRVIGSKSVLGQGSMFLFSACVYLIATYMAFLLPPEANSKRSSRAEGNADARLDGLLHSSSVESNDDTSPDTA